MPRQFEETHPWITFRLDLAELDHVTWMLIGEAIAQCDHVAGIPLQPQVAQQLNEIYLSKSAHATTQIEGNTLSEEEVRRRVRRELELPPSQEYLGQEIDNIVAAYNVIVADVEARPPLPLTTARVKEFNRLVLHDLPAEEDVDPGETRKKSVLVGNAYRGVPAEDCDYLLDRLSGWLEELRVTVPADELRQPVALLSAIVAHLYLAWIHPFGDGNGRTARLIEFQLLVQAGVPTVAAHTLSDFYNRTRTAYYRTLAKTSRPPYSVVDFVRYALEGFVDELRQQIQVIRGQQLTIMWQNYVHERFHDRNTPAGVRQRHLVLDLPPRTFTPPAKIPELSPRLAGEYHGKTRKTVTRDVNALVELGLIMRGRAGIRPFIEQMEAFLPLRAEPGPVG